MEAELERTKLEIREINLKYKEGDRMKPAMDPTGTKMHFKVSEIVKRKSKNESDDVKLFYSITDGVDQYFNSVQESPVTKDLYIKMQSGSLED